MSKILCIFPAEDNTEFLRPVFDDLNSRDYVYGLDKSSLEDEYIDEIESVSKNVDMIFFLGHGSSHTLYGDNNNKLFDDKFLFPLIGKKLILFACKTADFARFHKLDNTLGFGFIPSSEEDFEGVRFHNLGIAKLGTLDVDYLRRSISDILLKTLKECDIFNLKDFMRSFSFNANLEIVKYLTKRKDISNYRLLADVIYYINKDMTLV